MEDSHTKIRESLLKELNTIQEELETLQFKSVEEFDNECSTHITRFESCIERGIRDTQFETGEIYSPPVSLLIDILKEHNNVMSTSRKKFKS